jgi:hypothetical protein
MLASAIPNKIQLPFAANAGGLYIRTIPVPSQIGVVNGEASWNDGFPPLNFLPDSAGGINPDGRDMNGVLNAISALLWWYSAGAPISYDSAFQTAIGGYPNGAIIQSAVVPGILWRSTADNNVTNPDIAGAGWINASPFTGLSNITMTGANVTATLAQYGVQIINITGTLTANLNLILPNLAVKWLIVNNTTGAYAITAKTAAGTGVLVAQGGNTDVYGDGTNIYQEASSVGRTWQAVTRTASTVYTNNTGRDIIFMFDVDPVAWSATSFSVTVGGVTMNFGGGSSANSGSATAYNSQVTIPNGANYSISITPAYSYELR